MKNKTRYIGLNQRIPFDVLDSSICFYLNNGIIDKDHIFEKMQIYTSGVNRAKKSTNYVVQILSRQKKFLDQFKKTIENTKYESLRVDDRKALCLCLISITFPIAYELLISLGKGFKVQCQINKKFISEKVMSIYGSNRTVDIAIDALLPMLIELNAIKRVKVSIYSRGEKLIVNNKFIFELIIFTDIILSNSKSILIDELGFKSWYVFFDISGFSLIDFSQLLTKKDSAVGMGYLLI